MKLVLAASGGVLGYLGWRSLDWPLIHDVPLLHYVAWLIARGAAPYRDVFDMNLPGAYLIHWGVLAAWGPGDLAWRVFDLAWLGATSALLYAYCRPLGGGAGALGAALLFALYHLSGGAWRAGQRDFLLCLLLLAGAYAVALGLERAGALMPLLLGGLALGAGVMVKPQAGLFWLGAALAAALGPRRASRSGLRAGAAVLGAGLVVPGLLMAWLAWRGGLGPFLSILTGYVLPLYGPLAPVSLAEAIGWHSYGWPLWALLGVLGGLGLAARVTPPHGLRRGLALVGVAYGMLHFALQGKGWEYHLYPLALFLCVLAAAGLGGLAPERGTAVRGLGLGRRQAALLAFLATVTVLGAKGVEALDAPWIADKARRVAAAARDLRPWVGPGDTVQTMDVTEGGVHALLTLGVRQPTRFIYDFHFFHHDGDPRIQALRDEFVAGLERGRPAAIVVFRDTWRRPGYERLRQFPALADLLERRYAIVAEGDGYRIYAKRAGS